MKIWIYKVSIKCCSKIKIRIQTPIQTPKIQIIICINNRNKKQILVKIRSFNLKIKNRNISY